MNTISIADISSIDKAAQTFLEQNPKPKTVAFYASMGVGKTTFIKALCKALKVEDTVNSPTFAIVNEYTTETGTLIYHFDLYRLEKKEELLDIGFEDYLQDNHWLFIEWPEIAEDFLPENTLRVKISEEENGARTLVF